MHKIMCLPTFVLFIVFAATIASPSENPMRITTGENVVSVHEGQDALLCYRYNGVPFKPCVQQLVSPQGANVLRDAPPDHRHHHALMFAITVDGVNFWEEYKEPGRQLHRCFTDMTIGRRAEVPIAGFTEQLDWINPRSLELMLRERRTIEVCRLSSSEVTLLNWRSEFELPAGKESATLSGSHYFGLGMRFFESMDAGGEFRNADDKAGEPVRGSELLVPSSWCAYTALANGKVVTVAMFGHPDNLRFPTSWFYMTKPFAYLSATMNLHKEPLTMTSGGPLVLRYAVAVWDGKADKTRIDQTYRRWMKNQSNIIELN